MYVCIYVCMYMYVCMCIYLYIYLCISALPKWPYAFNNLTKVDKHVDGRGSSYSCPYNFFSMNVALENLSTMVPYNVNCFKYCSAVHGALTILSHRSKISLGMAERLLAELR